MSARLKLIIAYDGSAFAGWQSQSHRNTVQDYVERAFRRIAGKRLPVVGAGRTDSGVHALAQCAQVDLADRRFSPARWTSALNAVLPATIRVLRAKYVPETFHARFSAKGKVYRYRIWSDRVLPPLELDRAWHVAAPVDFARLEKAAGCFLGRHDFAGFAANRGKPEENSVRTIRSIRVRRKGASIMIEFDGDGFLYKMARLMVGAIVQAAIGKLEVEQIEANLESGRSCSHRFSAPAAGLYLVKVRY